MKVVLTGIFSPIFCVSALDWQMCLGEQTGLVKKVETRLLVEGIWTSMEKVRETDARLRGA